MLSLLIPIHTGIAHIFLYDKGERIASLGEAGLGAAVSALMLWLLRWTYEKVRHREGLGLGDVKMVAMMGAFLGLQGAILTIMVGIDSRQCRRSSDSLSLRAKCRHL